MNQPYLIFAALLAAGLLIRAIVFRGRKLREPHQILSELRLLPCPVSIEDSEMWGLQRDSEFWSEIKGMSGLWRIRRKALHLKDFVRSLNLSPEDADEMRFISQRCYWITVLASVQFALLPFSAPHFMARWAAGLYSEVRTRTLTLCQEYNRDYYVPLRASA